MTIAARTARRAAGVGATVLLAGAASVTAAAPAGAQAEHRSGPFAAFVRSWYGHDRTLSIGPKGVGQVQLRGGCCPPTSYYRFRLSHPHRTAKGFPQADLVITRMHFDKGAWRVPGVHVGSTGVATIRRGVYRDTVLHTTFCAPVAGGQCGA